MITAIVSGVLAIAAVFVQNWWQKKQDARDLARQPLEDVRRTQAAATAGDEGAVQAAFADWDAASRMPGADGVPGR
jgi:hypothetical protein